MTIVVPCHRVVFSECGVGKFGEGLERKRYVEKIREILPEVKGAPDKFIDLRKFFFYR